MQASAGQSISDKLTEQMAAQEAQREFIFYSFSQKRFYYYFFHFSKEQLGFLALF